MPSIRKKISFGFYVFVAIIALLTLISYSDLRYLERRIDSGVVIYEFLDAVLEFRLHEKSYLLHYDPQSLQSTLHYAAAAGNILAADKQAFLALRDEPKLQIMESLLRDYTRLLSEHQALAPNGEPPPPRLMNRAQQLGEQLTTIAESLAQAERVELGRSVSRSQWALLASAVFIALLGTVAGSVLSRVSVRPLAWMEAKLAAIGEGRYSQLEPVSKDLEIVSMSRAVNRMLHEIEVRNRHLMQAEKLVALGTLTSGIAHELNNPLSNISTSCQILMEEIEQHSDADPLEWLGLIDGETERAKRIVQSVLEFSKKNRRREEEVDLGEVIDKSLLLMRQQDNPRIHRGGVPAETKITTDAQKLQQIFINLLRNALDAGGSEVQIRIGAQCIAAADFRLPEGVASGKRVCTANPEGRAVVIEVEDDGPGIAPEILPRVFDPFFTTKDVGHGEGLGLYVTEEIVDLLGGCIGAGNGPRGGARFVVCLPCGEGRCLSAAPKTG